MLEEYEITNARQTILIPLAAAEGAALEIYNRMLSRKTEYPYPEKYRTALKTERSPEKAAEMVLEIIARASAL